ncbi:hypothetical protein ACWT_4424 [Actinoplanes sp. SE50]|uniref:DUF4097 family beta strand repeat-containing protein n=1 Tax=unclassified Actinoplanes TaxID=2626549 RepID=UPI00023ECCEB|nr:MULTISPECIES: DUF4097 family beta strand repeat-containing protein [unclassified Actinoplanes]AEV85446.1 hypothetical protein ACPL_4555 [Actinoplanes sp. SE50/110]ATO83839.1 hypothetical protein ACWT_4424 [Actinoplanes sp. SE50]SLM01249.1 uncharacterized protein ACSP50_4485 [Actinoplanes sp. SE50/110]
MPLFDTPGPIAVSADLVAADLHVIASDRADTVVTVTPGSAGEDRDVRAAEQTRVEFASGTLIVRGPRQAGFGIFGRVGTVDVVIEVPTGSDLEVKLGVGGARCIGAFGACRLRSGAGDLRVEQAESLSMTTGMGLATAESVTGDAHLTTGSGKLRVDSVTGPAVLKNGNGDTWVGHAGGELRVNAANGDIGADHATGPVTANTANGNIQVRELVRGVATLRSSAGRIEVGVRTGTAARLDVHTSYGKIRNELTAADGPAETDERAEIRARTSFGDILIHRA